MQQDMGIVSSRVRSVEKNELRRSAPVYPSLSSIIPEKWSFNVKHYHRSVVLHIWDSFLSNSCNNICILMHAK